MMAHVVSGDSSPRKFNRRWPLSQKLQKSAETNDKLTQRTSQDNRSMYTATSGAPGSDENNATMQRDQNKMHNQRPLDEGSAKANPRSESVASDSIVPELINLSSPMHDVKSCEATSWRRLRTRKAQSECQDEPYLNKLALSTVRNQGSVLIKHGVLYRAGMSGSHGGRGKHQFPSIPPAPALLAYQPITKHTLNGNVAEFSDVSAKRQVVPHSHDP